MKKFFALPLALVTMMACMGTADAFAARKVKAADKAAEEAPTTFTQLLWPDNKAPHPKEVFWHYCLQDRDPGVNIGDTARIYAFIPPASKANGKAIVLCPGGGYLGLCMSYEGGDWAKFFNDEGIALFVLQYRLPHSNRNVPVEDVQEAIRFVRRNASQWGINPNAIGVGGSSAGGHLASTASTHFAQPVNEDPVSCRPDFQVLFYPVISMQPDITHFETRLSLLGPAFRPGDENLFSNELQVTPDTPRTWIGLSDDDSLVPPENAIRYYQALHRNKVPAALYIYPTGEHGWGVKDEFPYHTQMLSDLRSWLRSF